jgi:hypothetical protein
MSGVDEILKLIGLLTVIVVFSLLVLSIFVYAYSAIIGFTHAAHGGVTDQDKLVDSLKDYDYQLELVKEQTQRLDMYYAAKTATEMSQPEFKSWIQAINSLTDEFIKRENNATASGRVYMSYLKPNSSEYDRVLQNEETAKSDISKVKYAYNGNVYIYNLNYGKQYGEIKYLP